MKEIYASAELGITGLLIFFCFFMGVLAWVFWPGSEEKFKQQGNIPLKDDSDE